MKIGLKRLLVKYENIWLAIYIFYCYVTGPNPPLPEDKHPETEFLGVDPGLIPYSSSESSSTMNNVQDSNLVQMNCSPTRYSAQQGSIVEIKDWNLLEHNTQNATTGIWKLYILQCFPTTVSRITWNPWRSSGGPQDFLENSFILICKILSIIWLGMAIC